MQIPINALKKLVYFSFLALSACAPVIPSNQASQSRNGSFDLKAKLQFFRTQPKALELYFSVPCEQLLFARSSENEPLAAKVEITCTAFNSKTNETGWSISEQFSLNQNRCDSRFLSALNLEEQADYIGEVLVKVEDLNRGTQYTAYSNITEDRRLSQHYLAYNHQDNLPTLMEQYTIGDSINVKVGLTTDNSCAVRVYQVPHHGGVPPYQENKASIWPELAQSLQLPVRDSFCRLPVSQSPSILEVKNNFDTEKPGFILNYFKPGFPSLNDGSDMLDPLMYLCKEDEFNQLRAEPDPRKAAENFWISNCKSKDKARKILAEYYRRVKIANENFSSFAEGWKTDRGMVYIIYGKPESISRRAGEEIWIYGREINTVRLSFTFRQKPNPFSFNHYELERNIGYRPVWDLAVNSWRNGRVFSY